MPVKKSKQSKYQNPAIAILTGVADLFRKKGADLEIKDSDRLDGKKVFITGASSGLGLATAVELARRGAHVIMAVRTGIPERGEEVKRRSGSGLVDMVSINLSDLHSLRKVAEDIRERFGQLDVVICNAAMVSARSRKVSGLDEMFLVNYFAKYLMINYLIELKCIGETLEQTSRIIFVASESHRNPEKFEWENFGKYEPYGTGKSVAMYGYNKLLLVTLARELSRRYNSHGSARLAVHALCPGPVNSNIAREAPALFQPLLKLIFSIFFRSPEKACRPVIYLAASKELEGISGEYLFLMQRKPVDEKAADPENGWKIWEYSESLRTTMGL